MSWRYSAERCAALAPVSPTEMKKMYDEAVVHPSAVALNYPLATLRILPLGNWFEVLVPGVHPGYGPTTSRLVSPRHPDFAAVKAEYARQTQKEAKS